MDLKDLKKVWDQYSSAEKGQELDEATIKEMLGGRTKNLMERIDRNIRIGFLVILALIVVFIADDLLISPLILNGIAEGLDVPGWIVILDIFTNLVIIATFIFFVNRYYRIKRECDVACDLPGTLKKIIHILTLYKRLFYYAIFVLLASSATDFIGGFFKGLEYSAEVSGISVSEIPLGQITINILIGLIVLVLISVGLFIFFKWGFQRLYGNYIQKMEDLLGELNDIN